MVRKKILTSFFNLSHCLVNLSMTKLTAGSKRVLLKKNPMNLSSLQLIRDWKHYKVIFGSRAVDGKRFLESNASSIDPNFYNLGR